MRDPVKARERHKRYRLRKKIEKFGSEKAMLDLRGRHGNHPKGSANGRYSDGLTITAEGYIKVKGGISHPLADPNGYAYLHHLVVASSARGRPQSNEVIHHKDGNTTNNALENLEVLTRSEHSRIHAPKLGHHRVS